MTSDRAIDMTLETMVAFVAFPSVSRIAFCFHNKHRGIEEVAVPNSWLPPAFPWVAQSWFQSVP
jgi:hypothetical protein